MARPMQHLQIMEPTTEGFDYDALDLSDRTALRQSAARIRERMTGIHRNLIVIGAELIRAKERLPRGTFLAWAENELGISMRSAQHYMTATAFLEAVPELAREGVSHLPPTTLYKLASRSTPKEIVAEVVHAAEAGALPPPGTIMERIAEARREAREVARLRKAKPGRSADAAKRILAKRRKAEAEARARAHAEAQTVAVMRAFDLAVLKRDVARLVTEHRSVMEAVQACLEGPQGWQVRDLLSEALAVPREAAASAQEEAQAEAVAAFRACAVAIFKEVAP